MFSFFKKDPLHKELKRAKKAKKVRNKWDRKESKRKKKKNNRIITFLSNSICPECGGVVRSTIQPAKPKGKNLYFKCTECSFNKHYYTNDAGKLLV